MDNDEGTVITCAISIEWLNAQGISLRKVSHKLATMRLLRNDAREMFLEVSTEKTPVSTRLLLKEFVVHKKFMNEGKASFNFNREKCILYASNAPPGLLANFLRTLFVKMTTNGGNATQQMQKDVRAKMLSELPSKFEDISPVTTMELARAKKLACASRSTPTTPSPPAKKRRFDQVRSSLSESGKENVAKKAHVERPNSSVAVDPMIKLNDEQNQVLKACLNGKNIFFTGSAGTGKSFLLRKIISVLPPDGTVATASTGLLSKWPVDISSQLAVCLH